MPEFKKGNDWSNKFLSKSPWKKETRWEGPKSKEKVTSDGDEKVYKPKMVEAEMMKDPRKLYHSFVKVKRPTKQLKARQGTSHLKATIAKDPTIDEELAKETRLEGPRGKKVKKKEEHLDEPLFEGGDITKGEWNKMSKEEQKKYVEQQGEDM